MLERDDQGRPSRWVTEIEPEFNDAERDDWYSLWDYEQSLCPQCGGPRDECESPEAAWYPQRHRCFKTAAQENVSRRFYEKHRDDKPDSMGFKASDGSLIWMSPEDLTPDDDFV